MATDAFPPARPLPPMFGWRRLRVVGLVCRVAWRDDAGKPVEALVRMPLKELLAQLDAAQFAQVHRSVVVNLGAISRITRGENETAHMHLKGRDEVLPVSRTHAHQFKPG